MDNQPIRLDENGSGAPQLKRMRTKTLSLGIGMLLVVVAVVAFCVLLISNNKETQLTDSIEKRLELLAGSRAEVISTWLAGLVNQGDRIVQSELFRLFAAEVDLLGDDVSLLVTGQLKARMQADEDAPQLEDQLPMMQNLLEEFSRYSGFRTGRLLNRNGQTYLATDANTSPLTPKHREHVKTVLSTNQPYFTPARHTANGLVIEIFLPVAPLQSKTPVSVLMLSKTISDKINELLARSPLMGEGERTRLLQKSSGEYQEIVPWMPGELTSLSNDFELSDENLAFSVRPSLTESRKAYSFGQKVPELDWWILQESDYQIARKSILNYTRFLLVIAVLTVLFCIAFLGGIWWRLVGIQNQRSARRFKVLADQIDEQRSLLDSINNTLTEFITLKDVRGFYMYANPAFANAIGRSVDEMTGLDDTALFGYDTAKRLAVSDQWVLENKASKNFRIDLYIQSKLHHLQASKVPLLDPSGKIVGIGSLFKDMTEIVQVRRKSEKSIRQTIEILVKAIEKTDPYLSGHSQLMSKVSKLVAQELNLGEQEIATIEISANLSQIGKMFIDQNLLNKPGMLTDEERREVERHVEHSASLLDGVDFDLPIAESVLQMNEFMDGSGYPQGLKGDAISVTGRILSVTNSFCAMVAPRAYRDPMPSERVLTILKDAADRYDPEVVRALVKVISSATGEKILRSHGER